MLPEIVLHFAYRNTLISKNTRKVANLYAFCCRVVRFRVNFYTKSVCCESKGIISPKKIKMKNKLLLAVVLCVTALTTGVLSYRTGSNSITKVFAENETNLPPDATNKAILVELFTSQSCASCPTADYFLTRLEESQPVKDIEVITLAWHVDYYDAKKGWRDVFGTSLASERQTEYGKTLKLPQVFTPHFFIDGIKEASGNNMSKLQFTIIEAAKEQKANVQIKVTDANATFKKQKSVILDVEIDNLPKRAETADVIIAITENGLITKIKKGENIGQDLKNDSVVRQTSRVGTVSADQNSFKGQAVFQPSDDWKKENTRAVIFVQETVSRKILGAGRIMP